MHFNQLASNRLTRVMIVVRYFFPPRTNTLIEHATIVQLFNERVKEKDSINVPVNHFACCRERNELCGEHKCSKVRTVEIEG